MLLIIRTFLEYAVGAGGGDAERVVMEEEEDAAEDQDAEQRQQQSWEEIPSNMGKGTFGLIFSIVLIHLSSLLFAAKIDRGGRDAAVRRGGEEKEAEKEKNPSLGHMTCRRQKNP